MGQLSVNYQTGWRDLAPGIPCELQAVEGWVTVDQATNLKKRKWSRLMEFPIETIERIEVEAINAAGSHWDGWRPTTGLLHRARKIQATTGVMVVLKSGESILFSVRGRAPIEVRAAFAPVASLLA